MKAVGVRTKDELKPLDNLVKIGENVSESIKSTDDASVDSSEQSENDDDHTAESGTNPVVENLLEDGFKANEDDADVVSKSQEPRNDLNKECDDSTISNVRENAENLQTQADTEMENEPKKDVPNINDRTNETSFTEDSTSCKYEESRTDNDGETNVNNNESDAEGNHFEIKPLVKSPSLESVDTYTSSDFECISEDEKGEIIDTKTDLKASEDTMADFH